MEQPAFAPHAGMTAVHPKLAVSLATFRERISRLVQDEKSSGTCRSIVILALDGIPFDLARACWPQAQVEPMSSVFPTTSSAAWMSALTGLSVARHGIPGVVFGMGGAGADLINLYDYQDELGGPDDGNLFSDARDAGYTPLAMAGDLEAAPCSWLHRLLAHSASRRSPRFYAGLARHAEPPRAAAIVERLRVDIDAALTPATPDRPVLCWCFVEVDRYIHLYGYDDHVTCLLLGVERLATDLVEAGHLVVAHSDHGLVPNVHCAEVEGALGEIAQRYALKMGGAGRTRWFYGPAEQEAEIRAFAATRLAGVATVHSTLDYFARDSLAAARAGSVIIQAVGERFIGDTAFTHDHGAMSAMEVAVPYAVWGVTCSEVAQAEDAVRC
ncbi:alkaline phosphatase family protein [Paraburkholderia phenoliruptrix]|uniref:Alkaline phosphatase family protein n=1 Tax=Paraburkholderia phenoliruptrix TaxID=252970 RepID=A0ABV3WHN4_9BURK|nr:alkaline phosphatase family protein [Paraburkholderia phenoliruptrix]MDR6392489.1 hypothetical protein [Paraburkholderia phenoliruptrix]